MNKETQNKFAEILAAAQKQAQQKGEKKPTEEQPKEVNNVIVKSYEIPETECKISKMKSFTIIWHEGTGEFDGKIFNTWNEANKAVLKIGAGHSGEGYTKVKINVIWEDGSEITDRIDCGFNGSDFNYKNHEIGSYLKSMKGVMYASNLKKGDRITKLSFEDDKENLVVPEIEAHSNFADDILSQISNSFEEPTFLDLYEEKPIVKTAQVRRNEERNGIEIVFKEKPAENVLNKLKANGFKWSNYAKLWWATFTDDKFIFANSL